MKIFLLLAICFLAAVSAKPPKQKIGFYRPNPHIINGQDAEEGQFPYQISYQWGIFGLFQHVCGGSIISPTWVLTAGHCVTEVPGIGDYKVIAGITDLYEENSERQEISVVEKVVHPNFGGDVGANDIALLKLSTPLTFGTLVQPIQLPAAGSEPSGQVILSGWGSIGTVIIDIMPEQLQTVTVPLLTFEECNAAIELLLEQGEDSPLSETSNICTGPLTGGISACSGDSGGPLAQNGEIVGIVSWGFIPCGADGSPSVYTKVSSFIDFIKATVSDLPK